MHRSRLFASSRMEAIPVLCAVAHCAYAGFLFSIFPAAPWWALILLGFVYSGRDRLEHQQHRAQP